MHTLSVAPSLFHQPSGLNASPHKTLGWCRKTTAYQSHSVMISSKQKSNHYFLSITIRCDSCVPPLHFSTLQNALRKYCQLNLKSHLTWKVIQTKWVLLVIASHSPSETCSSSHFETWMDRLTGHSMKRLKYGSGPLLCWAIRTFQRLPKMQCTSSSCLLGGTRYWSEDSRKILCLKCGNCLVNYPKD